jgi:hypothetical protein
MAALKFVGYGLFLMFDGSFRLQFSERKGSVVCDSIPPPSNSAIGAL